MIFNKKLSTSFGVEASLWEIVETVINTKTKTITVILAGYFDEQAYNDNKNPLEGKAFCNRVNKENKTKEESQIESDIFDSLKVDKLPVEEVATNFINKYIKDFA